MASPTARHPPVLRALLTCAVLLVVALTAALHPLPAPAAALSSDLLTRPAAVLHGPLRAARGAPAGSGARPPAPHAPPRDRAPTASPPATAPPRAAPHALPPSSRWTGAALACALAAALWLWKLPPRLPFAARARGPAPQDCGATRWSMCAHRPRRYKDRFRRPSGSPYRPRERQAPDAVLEALLAPSPNRAPPTPQTIPSLDSAVRAREIARQKRTFGYEMAGLLPYYRTEAGRIPVFVLNNQWWERSPKKWKHRFELADWAATREPGDHKDALWTAARAFLALSRPERPPALEEIQALFDYLDVLDPEPIYERTHAMFLVELKERPLVTTEDVRWLNEEELKKEFGFYRNFTFRMRKGLRRLQRRVETVCAAGE